MYRNNKKDGKYSNPKIHGLMQMLSDWGNLKRKSRKGNLVDDVNGEKYFYNIARDKPTKIDKVFGEFSKRITNYNNPATLVNYLNKNNVIASLGNLTKDNINSK
jgi:hypothetical protein